MGRALWVKSEARGRPALDRYRARVGFTAAHRGGTGPPVVLIHGFTDTWRTWELILPALERHHSVLAPTLPGHAGGPPIPNAVTHDALADEVERTMDEAGFDSAHLVGNSLGGLVALQLAARGRARTVTALAPAGGWARGDGSHRQALDHFAEVRQLVLGAAPHADQIMATPEGRRRATRDITVNFEHIPADLLAHQLRGAAACDATLPLIDFAKRDGYRLDAGKISCPVRFVWGLEDRVLPWPRAAAGYRENLQAADWILLENAGHCLQLDLPRRTAELILEFAAKREEAAAPA